MFGQKFNDKFSEPDSAWALIRRLLSEHAWGLRKSYALAFVFMGTVAATTALAAYLFGNIINQTYVDKTDATDYREQLSAFFIF